MNKKFKLFAILSLALVLSLCLVFAACNTTPATVVDNAEDTDVAKSDSKVVSSLTFEDKEEFDVKDEVLHLYEKDFEKKGSQIIVENAANLSVGQVVLLDYETDQDESYIITDYNKYGDKAALTVELNNDVYGVYDNIDVSKSIALSDDGATVEWIDDAEIIAQFMQSDLAFGIEGLFDTPSVSIPTKDINKEEGYAHIVLEISFPIYKNQGYGFDSRVTIKLDNMIYVDSDCNFNLAPLKLDLGADMTVITDTTFSLKVSEGLGGQKNAEDVVAKLISLFGKDPAEFNLTIFSWSYPVGPLLISYDLDVKFNVKFEGEFNMTATSQVECYLGASYDSQTAKDSDEKAFDVVFEKGEKNYIELTKAELFGTLKTSAGIVNTLRLDILAVAGVGLRLDLGLYADLYGAVEINVTDGLKNIKESNGGYYFEPGFYYSVDLLAGLNIANLIKLDKTFNLANGNIPFTGAILGNKTFVVNFENVPETVEIVSDCYVLPTYQVRVYDLISKNDKIYNTVDYTALNVTMRKGEDSNLEYADGVITIKNPAAEVDEEVVIALKDASKITKTITFKKVSNVPFAKNSVATFDKNKDVVGPQFELNLNGEEFNGVEGLTYKENYTFADNKLIISEKYLCTLENGRYEFVINTSEHAISVYVNVEGTLGLTTVGEGTKVSPYLIYSVDQLEELSATAAKNNYWTGKYFRVENDIDFEGKEFAPIPGFSGEFNGNNKAIKNFVINTTVDGNTGFFATNGGTIKDLTLKGTVTINEQIVVAGGIVGENGKKGTIENVTSEVDVIVTFKTSTSKHNSFRVGGVVGYNKGTVKAATAKGKVSALTTGITSASNVIYVAGVIGYNEAESATIDGLACEATVEFDDSWYKLNKVFHDDIIANA